MEVKSFNLQNAEGMSIGIIAVMKKSEKLWKREGQKRPEGRDISQSRVRNIVKSCMGLLKCHSVDEFLAITYSLLYRSS